MLAKRWTSKHKAALILGAGMIAAFTWMVLLPTVMYQWWMKCSFLPAWFYFPIEEFLAINNHQNSLYAPGGGIVIASLSGVWAFKICKDVKKFCKFQLFLFLFFFLLVLLFPCLCRPREIALRAHCRCDLKDIYYYCEKYAQNNGGVFPENVDIDKIKHRVNYMGRGRKISDKPFVLLEDGERVHAGDMRHRIWSNGENEDFYPWK